ncbi:unnamed protein product [Schistosoma spindalis]|nr:unnamed protein product [Schistosoma spindale]
MCIDSNDKDTHSMKVDDCRVKMTTKVTERPTDTTERTDRSPDTTVETTRNDKQKKTSQCLYVLIFLVISFFVSCISCIIGRSLYKRRKVMNYSQ